jgi:phosphate transport system substrate-binding protein
MLSITQQVNWLARLESQEIRLSALLGAAALLATAGCGARVEGIRIDGSSTVYPISDAVAEAYYEEYPGTRVTVGLSGTGGGFQKFASGEIDICDASREIRDSEIEACAAAKAEYLEFSVAFDGIAVVVNPQNDWCDCLTIEQLASIWRPNEPARKWSELDPEWPDEPIKLPDFTASEDDNVLVTGVAEDKFALGYFGFAYYTENYDRLTLLGVKAGDGECIKPTIETVRTNTYRPLSRPLFIYVRKDLFERAEGKSFVKFYLDNTSRLSEEVGYVAVSDEVNATNQTALEQASGATAE